MDSSSNEATDISARAADQSHGSPEVRRSMEGNDKIERTLENASVKCEEDKDSEAARITEDSVTNEDDHDDGEAAETVEAHYPHSELKSEPDGLPPEENKSNPNDPSVQLSPEGKFLLSWARLSFIPRIRGYKSPP